MILIITVIGTAKIIPRNPQIYPHKERQTRITNGESPRFFPSILGSKIFPSPKFTQIIKISTKIGFPIEYEDKNNIVRNGLFLREPEIKELEKRLKKINKLTDLEQQCKKQKEVINKATEYIKERFYFNEETGEYSLLHTIDKDNIKELLDILNEVSE